MAISRMLKLQLLAHVSGKEAVKRFLREAGVVEVTDVSVEEREVALDEDRIREVERELEMVDASIEFLGMYTEKPSFFERISRGKLVTSRREVAQLSREVDVPAVWRRCSDIERRLRSARDELARSRELIRDLDPWRSITVPLETLSTAGYEVQFWTLPAQSTEDDLARLATRLPGVHIEVCSRDGGRIYIAVIVSTGERELLAETLKELGCFMSSFEDVKGTPEQAIEHECSMVGEHEKLLSDAQAEARELAAERDKLLILSDWYVERIALATVEKHLHNTASTFLLEGWVRAVDRRRLERELAAKYQDTEIAFRTPRDEEEPPISLTNGPALRPYEFVTTLYGRPVYREVDPTPLLAPFFILFFALCLTDAGYGLTLAAVSAVMLRKLRPSGGAAMLMRLLLMGGIVTAVIGIVTGGIFGIEASGLPAFIRAFIFINPLEEPMKMLNIAFLMGLVHILFGMGIRMISHFREGLVTDALFDDLLWILFLVALAPLGFSAILGGDVPHRVMFWCKGAAVAIAAAIFVTGGRRQKSIIGKFFKGLIGFYDVVGYFGDILSYARLLALGLATSAIALAVNGIAGMVKGLPFYTGYVAAVLVLVVGHAFNLAVNTLGAFVHSGRLQYLEFFSKFFVGGGKEFRPYKHERRYTVMRGSDT